MQFLQQLNNIIINSSLLSPGLTVEDDNMFYLVHLNRCLNDVSASDNAISTNVSMPCNELSVDEIISTLHPEAQKLVNRFKSIFPVELPKQLPPKRAI